MQQIQILKDMQICKSVANSFSNQILLNDSPLSLFKFGIEWSTDVLTIP